MKTLKLIAVIIAFSSITTLHAQEEIPIWDIGTKWTYELSKELPEKVTYLINEIVDTVTIDEMKLYMVTSEPISSGIWYFYYKDDKVYNYNPNSKILQLLYDFEETNQYSTTYIPICDPSYDYSNTNGKNYTIDVDSVGMISMPDNSLRRIQYVSSLYTLIEEMDTTVLLGANRSVLDEIGFFEGGLHNSHDWEMGMYICDELDNFLGRL